MAAITQPHVRDPWHWFRESTWVTAAWHWFSTLICAAAEPILIVCFVYFLVSIIPGISIPHNIDIVVVTAQSLVQDIAGIGLMMRAKRAKLEKDSEPYKLGQQLIWLMFAGLVLAGAKRALNIPDSNGYMIAVEFLFGLARSWLAIKYGPTLHALNLTLEQMAEEQTIESRVEERINAIRKELRSELQIVKDAFQKELQSDGQKLQFQLQSELQSKLQSEALIEELKLQLKARNTAKSEARRIDHHQAQSSHQGRQENAPQASRPALHALPGNKKLSAEDFTRRYLDRSADPRTVKIKDILDAATREGIKTSEASISGYRKRYFEGKTEAETEVIEVAN